MISAVSALDPELGALIAVARQGGEDGVRDVLARLNARVAHRYTGIYRLDDDMLRCVHLVDKLGTVQAGFLAEVSLQDSFCQFVFRDGVFETENSSFDHRLDGLPYQGVVVSYHAIPLLAHGGTLYGTLCHLDTVPRLLPEAELDLLRCVSGLLSTCLERRAAGTADTLGTS